MRPALMRAIFLTWRRSTILRCGIRRPHIVARLPASTVRGIFARHRAVHITPVILRTVYLMDWSLRTSNFAVHRAIIYTPIDPIVHASIYTVIHTMVAYRSRRDHIVTAEFSRS